ncbi:MAG: cytochrome d ubiquinol oxidase subunit II [Deltaproteobacteria bacterium]|nr:cytochrome d ubiquinol oxidase subunit II [Deltaproteobacteria bacterium]
MIELWYAALVFMIATYVVLDGRNFGIGMLHLLVARTRQERRQVIAAIGPLWTWHEVWLVAFGGVLLVAFPRLYAVAFSGYYLALFLILWCLVFRGIALEVGGHIDDAMWQAFWDVVFSISNILLAVVFGVALGNVLRGVPVDQNGNFPLSFFTTFSVRGSVGLLDWYTLAMSLVCCVFLVAHGATYLTLKTEGPVHDRAERVMRLAWKCLPFLFVAISAATWAVRPHLHLKLSEQPLQWVALVVAFCGAFQLYRSLQSRDERGAFAGSCAVLGALLVSGGAAIFPVVLYSTIAPEYSLTIYNCAADERGLQMAARWWPIALVLTCAYFLFISRYYRGKVKASDAADAYGSMH